MFDRRAGELATMRRDACTATHVRRQQSPELLDRRSRCLDIRTAELAALAGVFANAPDAEVTERAISAALALPPVAECADADRLLAQIPPPADAATRAAVEQVETRLALASALVYAGKYKAAAEVIDPATVRADELAYAPLRARAHTRRARVLAMLEKFELAIGELALAGELAAAAHDDVLLARIWIEHYGLTGSSLGRARDVAAMPPVLAAAVVRAGNSPALRAQLAGTVGAVQIASGDFAAAAVSFAEARDRHVEASGPDDPEAAAAMLNRAIALGSAARFDDARAAFDQALAAQTAIFGTEHPMIAHTKGELAGLLDEMGKPEEALAMYQEVAALEDKLLPADHPRRATTYGNIAVVLDTLGRYDEALTEHERALAILGVADDNALRIAAATANFAVTLLHQGRRPEAIAAYERALAMREKVLGPDHPDVAWTLNQMAIAITADDPDRAREMWQRVLAIRRAKLGEQHPDTGMTYGLLAQDAYTRSDYTEAAELIRRAIDIVEAAGADQTPAYPDLIHMRGLIRTEQHHYPAAVADLERARELFIAAGNADDAANTSEALAKVQWQAGPPLRSRAIATARTALEHYLAVDAKAEAAALRTWIARHVSR